MILLPGMASAAVSADSKKNSNHYIPLNGRSLREIAGAREHHGPDGFINPLGPGRQGRQMGY